MNLTLKETNLEQPVTRHMRRDVVKLHTRQTVGEALDSLRRQPPPGRILYCYVVDDEDRLRGVVPTRRLLLRPLDTPLADVMVSKVVALPDVATVLDACEFFIQHRFLALPVVDAQGRLLGQVDVELYTDGLAQLGDSTQRDDLFQLIGVHAARATRGSPVAAFRSRFPWLLCNIAGGLLAAFLAGLYTDELSRMVELSLFIPVVLALAESVSIQSVSLAIQGLHGRRPTVAALLAGMRRELATGALLGIACALLVGMVGLVWLGKLQVFGSLLGGIAGSVAAAAVLGLAMPIVLRMMRSDPRVAAGPIALASADLVTLLLYFNLARWLLDVMPPT
jgi:magnesium transporter